MLCTFLGLVAVSVCISFSQASAQVQTGAAGTSSGLLRRGDASKETPMVTTDSESNRRPLMRSQSKKGALNSSVQVLVSPSGTWATRKKSQQFQQFTSEKGMRRPIFPGGPEEMVDPKYDKIAKDEERSCGLAPWSPWSVCNKDCGMGRRVRTRDGLGLLAEYFTLGAQDSTNLAGKKADLARSEMTVMLAGSPLQEQSSHKVAVRWSGQLLVKKAGRYTFDIGNERSGRLKVGAALVAEQRAENSGVVEKPISKSYKKWLPKGSHSILLEVFGEGQGGMVLKYSGADTYGKFATIPASALRHQVTKAHCKASAVETQICNRHSCAVDCLWHDWEQWASCSQTCGGGTMKRIRQVAVLAQHGGNACEGPGDGDDGSTEHRPCNSAPCGFW